MVKLKQYQQESRVLDIEKATAKTEYMKLKLEMHRAAVAYYEQAIAKRLLIRTVQADGCDRGAWPTQ